MPSLYSDCQLADALYQCNQSCYYSKWTCDYNVNFKINFSFPTFWLLIDTILYHCIYSYNIDCQHVYILYTCLLIYV